MAWEGMDSESLALMIELQLSDFEGLSKGKGKEGETSDKEVAMSTYKSELESLASFQSDRVLCQSIARAVKLDGDAIRSHLDTEQQATRDRRQALGADPRPANRANVPSKGKPALGDDLLHRLEALNVYDDKGSVAESSSWAASRPHPSGSLNASANCIACGDAVPSNRAFQSPCSHSYCSDCLSALFHASFTDESLFPPRCCKLIIPIDLAKKHLSPSLVTEYRAKEIEYGTPNRTYCHRPTCSAFIPPASIKGDTATCRDCGHSTCAICKVESHENECPADIVTQEVLRIASENGWQRCHSCRRMVELETGCNHMTCLCGAQFCYVCGVPWKNCRCAQWDENRLLTRANDLVDRNNRGHNVDEGRRRRLVEAARQNLVQNHQCAHSSWRSRGGSYRCEECYDFLPQYIYECRQCSIMACRRCRFNRL